MTQIEAEARLAQLRQERRKLATTLAVKASELAQLSPKVQKSIDRYQQSADSYYRAKASPVIHLERLKALKNTTNIHVDEFEALSSKEQVIRDEQRVLRASISDLDALIETAEEEATHGAIIIPFRRA